MRAWSESWIRLSRLLFAILAKEENNRKQGRNVLTTSRKHRAVIGDRLAPPFLSSRKPSLVGMTTILVTRGIQSPTQNFAPRHFPLDWHTKHETFNKLFIFISHMPNFGFFLLFRKVWSTRCRTLNLEQLRLGPLNKKINCTYLKI